MLNVVSVIVTLYFLSSSKYRDTFHSLNKVLELGLGPSTSKDIVPLMTVVHVR